MYRPVDLSVHQQGQGIGQLGHVSISYYTIQWVSFTRSSVARVAEARAIRETDWNMMHTHTAGPKTIAAADQTAGLDVGSTGL